MIERDPERAPRSVDAMLRAGRELLRIAAEGAGALPREDWLLVMAALLRGTPDPHWRTKASLAGVKHEPETLLAIERRTL